jgi:GNAT superfamily N-acetyltransferase
MGTWAAYLAFRTPTDGHEPLPDHERDTAAVDGWTYLTDRVESFDQLEAALADISGPALLSVVCDSDFAEVTGHLNGKRQWTTYINPAHGRRRGRAHARPATGRGRGPARPHHGFPLCDGVLAGWLNIRREPHPLVAHWGTVHHVQSHTAFRDRGIGSALMNHVRQVARDEMDNSISPHGLAPGSRTSTAASAGKRSAAGLARYGSPRAMTETKSS